MPPRPEFHGSTAARARAVATAASTALPPAWSTARPAAPALVACAAMTPRRPDAAGLVRCQFCVMWGAGVKGMVLCKRDRREVRGLSHGRDAARGQARAALGGLDNSGRAH